MNVRKDMRGFSLIELIIVMAIMAIFAGVFAGAMGYINTGKTKKASAKLNSRLTYIQTETMTKKGETYLYIYQTSDGVHYCILSSEEDSNGDGSPDYPKGFRSRSELDSYLSANDIGSKLCDSTVKLSGKDSTGGGLAPLTLGTGNMLKIGYSKATGAFTYSNNGQLDTNGEFDDVPFYSAVELSGKQTFTIKLVKTTGKHFVEEN